MAMKWLNSEFNKPISPEEFACKGIGCCVEVRPALYEKERGFQIFDVEIKRDEIWIYLAKDTARIKRYHWFAFLSNSWVSCTMDLRGNGWEILLCDQEDLIARDTLKKLKAQLKGLTETLEAFENCFKN